MPPSAYIMNGQMQYCFTDKQDLLPEEEAQGRHGTEAGKRAPGACIPDARKENGTIDRPPAAHNLAALPSNLDLYCCGLPAAPQEAWPTAELNLFDRAIHGTNYAHYC